MPHSDIVNFSKVSDYYLISGLGFLKPGPSSFKSPSTATIPVFSGYFGILRPDLTFLIYPG
jgi:hypothetical protein